MSVTNATFQPGALSQAASVLKRAPLYHVHRPQAHAIPPYGWVSDPTGWAALSNSSAPNSTTWHLYYQYNPLDSEWGNISWGHSVSPDLLHWETPRASHAYPDDPTLVLAPGPDTPAASEGVFTGCVRYWPNSSYEDREGLAAIHTGVSHLPLKWNIRYPRGAEKITLRTTKDGTNFDGISVLGEGPPEKFNVTGWRDPFTFSWPALRSNLNTSDTTNLTDSSNSLYNGNYFGVVAGGLKPEGPAVFLYALGHHPDGTPDYTKPWEYQALLAHVPGNTSLGNYSADLGWNWETATVVRFPRENSTEKEAVYVLLGVEGGKPWPTSGANGTHGNFSRNAGNARWIALGSNPDLNATKPEAMNHSLFTPLASSAFDYGSVYATHVVGDQEGKESALVWSWIEEDSLNETGRAAQGWGGFMALPREVFEQTITDVQGSLFSTPLNQSGVVLVDPKEPTTVRLLGSRPAKDVWKGLLDQANDQHEGKNVSLTARSNSTQSEPLLKSNSTKVGKTWAFCTQIELPSPNISVGIVIDHYHLGSLANDTKTNIKGNTTIIYDPSTSEIVVNRQNSQAELWDSKSQQVIVVDNSYDAGLLPLFHTGSIKDSNIEPIKLDLFYDGSVLEIFANDRFALTTRLYTATEHHSFRAWIGQADNSTDKVLFTHSKLFANISSLVSV